MAGLAAVPLINGEEREEAELEVESVLTTRPRRGRVQQNGSEEAGSQGEDSVYVDSDEGIWKCSHCIWTYLMENSYIDHILKHEVLHEGMNSKTVSQPASYCSLRSKGIGSAKEAETRHLEPLSNGQIKENGQETEKELKFENGSLRGKSHCVAETENLSGVESSKKERFSSSQGEIISDVPIRQITGIKEEVAEYDVEKVLDEQETHDLFCPNCHSCITKRVVFRKRKRTSKPLESESKREKLQIVDPDVQSDPVDQSIADQSQEHEVFRCLSCFSYFISTARGFKSFRIFGMKEEVADLQSTENSPIQNSAGLFAPSLNDKYPHKESGSQLHRDPKQSSGEQAKKNVLASQNLEAEPSSQGKEVTNFKVQTSSKQNVNGLHFFPFFKWRENVQKLESSQQETTTITNSVRAASDGTEAGSHGNTTSESDGKPDASVVQVNPLAKLTDFSNGKKESWNSSGSTIYIPRLDNFIKDPVGDNNTGGSSTEHVADNMSKGSNLHPKIANKVFDGTTNYIVNEGSNGILSEDPEININQNLSNQLRADQEELETSKGFKLESTTAVIGRPPQSDITTASAIIPAQQGADITLIHDGDDSLSEVVKIDKEKIYLQDQKNVLLPSIQEDNSISSASTNAGSIEQLDGVRQLQSESIQVIPSSAIPQTSRDGEIRINMGVLIAEREPYQWDILKSIVYGGLIESITSLGLVSAAAGSNANTLNIFILAFANFVGGLILLAHDLKELVSDHKTFGRKSLVNDKYYRTLGRRANFRLHIVVAFISYIIFGALPPIIYGFSFRKSDDKDYKLIAVAGASLLCILLLAVGKAHVQQSPQPYIKTIMYYLAIGLISSSLSYAVGELLKRAMEKTGLFYSSTGGSTPTSSASFIETWPAKTGWDTY